MLAPLTGRYAPYGASLVNAATLALFEAGDGVRLELAPQDTGATARGAANAAAAALAGGADALIGPVTAAGAKAAALVANANRAPIMALTSDRTIAAPGVYPVKRAPEAGAARIVDYAYRQGARRLVAIAPDTALGNSAVRGMQGAALARQMEIVGIAILPADAPVATLQATFRQAVDGVGPDGAIFLPYGPGGLASLRPAINPTAPPLLLGLENWDGARLADAPGLKRAVFAGVAPGPIASFRRRYAAAFGAAPVRDAAVVYDMAAMLGQIAGAGGSVDPAAGPGYRGIEGPFRLTRDGVVLRGYAVVGVQNGRVAAIEPAPTSLGF